MHLRQKGKKIFQTKYMYVYNEMVLERCKKKSNTMHKHTTDKKKVIYKLVLRFLYENRYRTATTTTTKKTECTIVQQKREIDKEKSQLIV